MFWNEKIDSIKRRFPSTNFKDPLKNGKKIIEKIIFRFFNSTGSAFVNSINKTALLRELIYLSSGQEEQEFCIVHKKYLWLFFFKTNRNKDIAEIHISGALKNA